ncbi:AAA family ATPase [Alicyclobacillus tolerans]|uniref:AAA family ATPase n=1 Tax=Alicyclobacillus tolerans TaxID=90970 RepID=UPI003B8264A7
MLVFYIQPVRAGYAKSRTATWGLVSFQTTRRKGRWMMKLMQIHVENFRCFEQETVSFQSGENRILAHNAQGKSTLMEAVVWCLYGTDALGKKNADTRLLRRGARSMKVETVWQIQQGQSLTILRIKPEQGAVQLLVNGNRPKPGTVEGWFGELQTFLSIFSPGYFSGLEPKEAKLVLGRVSQVDIEQVLEALLPSERTYLSNVHFGMGLDSADVLLKTLRSELKEHEEEALRLEGAIESWKAKLAESEPEPFQSTLGEAKLAEIAATQKELTRLELLLEKVPQEIKELQNRLQQARSRYMEVKQQLLPDIDANCPTCHQPLPKTQQEIAKNKRNAHNGKVQVLLKSIQEEGESLKAKIEQLSQPEHTRQLREKIQQMKQTLAHYAALVEAEKAAMVEYQSKKMMWDYARQSSEQNQHELEQVLHELEKIKQNIQAVKNFKWRYVQIQHKQLNEPLVHTHIELYTVNEDGEIKEAFGLTWNDKPYRTLSTSERVRCDLEISRLLMSLAVPEVLPVYVDNAESVEHLEMETFAGQWIAAYVSDCPLTVIHPDNTSMKKGA